MANLQAQAQLFAGDTSVVDTELRHPLGTKARDADGNEYIYLQGVASVAANTWVSFDEDYQTTILAANAVGRVAIAMAAIVASSYGWFQIYGEATGGADDVAADKAVYIDATAGRVDDAAVTGDLVLGAWSRSADETVGNTATFELNYPYVTDVLG